MPARKIQSRKPFPRPELTLVFFLAFVILAFSLPARLSGRVADEAAAAPAVPDVPSALSSLLGPDAAIVSIDYLSGDNLSSLAKGQPVVYGNITAPVYRAVVKKGGQSFLILYDFDSNVILRQFEVRQVQLN